VAYLRDLSSQHGDSRHAEFRLSQLAK
jgi:hypothetical protein